MMSATEANILFEKKELNIAGPIRGFDEVA